MPAVDRGQVPSPQTHRLCRPAHHPSPRLHCRPLSHTQAAPAGRCRPHRPPCRLCQNPPALRPFLRACNKTSCCITSARTVPHNHAKGNASLSLMPPTLPSAASACHSECHSEYRRHTESLHGAVFLNLPRRRCKKSGIAPNGTIPDFCLFSANDARKGSYIKGLQVSSRFVNAQKIAHISLMAA